MAEGGSSFRQLSPLTLRVVGIDYRAIPLPGQYDFEAYPYAQPAAVMSCVSQTGTATLCGFSEYASPSVPPKKYRRQTLGGGWCDNDYGDFCGGNIGNNDRQNYSGSYDYSGTNCAETNNQASIYGISGIIHPCSAVPQTPTTQPARNFAPSIYPNHTTLIETSISRIWNYNGLCIAQREVDGQVTANLSIEDTETDALERASKTPGVSCLAFTQDRGAGDFTFDFATVAYDILCAPLVRNHRYRLTYDFLTEDDGGGNPIIEPITLLFRADATTKHFVGILTAASGKQVSIVNIQLEALSSTRSALFGDGIQSDENHAFREIAPFTPRVVGIDYIAVPLPGNGNEGYYTYEDVPPTPPIPPVDNYLFLPPLTEDTGDLYPDEATAQSVLDDPISVRDCIVFFGPATFAISSLASQGVGFLQLGQSFGSPAASTGDAWCSINASAGQTILFSFSTNGGIPNGSHASIYNDEGVLIEFLGTGAGPMTSLPLPYTGRYTVKSQVFVFPFGVPFTEAGIIITPSDSFTLNPVRALYDCGNPDPCALDC